MRSEVACLPEAFLTRLRAIFPRTRFDSLANTFSEERPTSFRVNTAKAGIEEVREELSRAGFRLERVPWLQEGFVLREGTLRALQDQAVYREGKIYVQNLSSMIPALILDPQEGEKILDLTAAPGSKTSQIVNLMKAKGTVVANDNNRVRFFKLLATLKNQGCSTVQATNFYGESFARRYPGFFNRVLLDAPCSAEGRFQSQDPRSFGYWKPRKIEEMVRKQKRLLAAAVHSLLPGGVMVYSTCTFAPEENEGVLSWGYEKFAGVLEPCDPWAAPSILRSLPNAMRPLEAFEGKPYHPNVRFAARILPSRTMEGFFVAKAIKRTASGA